MKNFHLINHIQTAIAVINKDMTIVDANDAFQQRNNLIKNQVRGTKCFESAYNFKNTCDFENTGSCPVTRSFKTKETFTAVHHSWINDHAVVEEVTTTPIIEENGDVNYVIEEFHDVTQLLGLKKGILTICSYCRKIREKDGEWLKFEGYLQKHTGAHFSHGMCEDCHTNLCKNNNK